MHDIADTQDPLWTRARTMFARAVAKIGDASAIAALKLLTPKLRRDIIAWLAPLEHVVRKLLFAEAATLYSAERARAARGPRLVHVPLRGVAQTVCSPVNGGAVTRSVTEGGPPPSVARCAHDTSPVNGGGKTSRSKLDMAQPETWRAQFSFALPRDPHRVPDSRAPRIRALWGDYAPPSPTPERPARILNEEESPFRLARRFEALRRVLEDPRPHAERLARALAREVRRFSEAAQRYLFAPCRTNDYDPADPRLGLDATSAAFAAPSAFVDSS